MCFALDGSSGFQVRQQFAAERANSQDMEIGHPLKCYLWGPAVDQILAEEAVNGGADETVQWTLTDHLNTVRDIAKYNSQTDTTTVVNHLVYDAFGKVTSETNPAVDSLFLFTARPFDEDSPLQNNLNRWYDASVGRWLSEDPIGFAAGDGNLYRYVKNRSLNRVDALGLTTCEATGQYYARGAAVIQAIPFVLQIDFQTNPGGHGEVLLQRLVCMFSQPVVAKYRCCCHSRYHVRYADAELFGYSILDVLGHNLMVKVEHEISVPLPKPFDKLPFAPSIVVVGKFVDHATYLEAQQICDNIKGELMKQARIDPSQTTCPFHD